MAGGSAQREADRRRAAREATVRARHPHVGGLILALSDEPQDTKNWAKGAEGERQLGASLDALAEAGIVVLHDRLRPGTAANIDHLAVTPSGIWVIDAKHYRGEVARRTVGGWFSRDVRLYVGWRDRTDLVRKMATQVDAVRNALAVDRAGVPVRPMLCFVNGDWPLLAGPFELGGVLVTWPRAAVRVLRRPGPVDREDRERIARELDARLRPAS